VTRDRLHIPLAAIATVAFVAAIAYPTAAVLIDCCRTGWSGERAFEFGPRLWGLLWRSLWMSCAAVTLCLAYSVPAVFVLGRGRQASNRAFLWMCAALLLCPPMVYVFGWDRVVPALLEPHARCVVVWALWAWPVPTLILARAAARYRDEYHDAALLEASPWKGFRHVALPNLLTHAALAAVVLFVLFFNDYGVPHACGLTVYATELLGRATSSTYPADTLVPALPSLAVTSVALVAAATLWRKAPGFDRASEQQPHAAVRSPAGIWVAAAMFVLAWCVPITALAVKLTTADVERALRTYWYDLLATVGVAVLSGAVVIVVAVGTWQLRRARLVLLVWAMIWGAVPGAVVGESLIAAYNKPLMEWVYAGWPILMLGYVARFGWIGLAVATALHRRTDPSLLDQSATDGAGTGHSLRYVILPTHWPMLAAAAGLVAVLAIAELPVTAMIRPPGLAPISTVIIEKFHRFEDGLLIALSLSLVAVGLVVAAAWTWAVRRAGPGCHGQARRVRPM